MYVSAFIILGAKGTSVVLNTQTVCSFKIRKELSCTGTNVNFLIDRYGTDVVLVTTVLIRLVTDIDWLSCKTLPI